MLFMLAVLLLVQHFTGAARLGRASGHSLDRHGSVNEHHDWRTSGGVTFDRVSKRYGDMAAVDDVSFTIEPGYAGHAARPIGLRQDHHAAHAAGLETASSGRILIGGEDVTKRAASERNVSLVFQSYALFPHMSVLDNVCYARSRPR